MELKEIKRLLAVTNSSKFDAAQNSDVHALVKLLSNAVNEIELNLNNINEKYRKDRLKLCLLQFIKVLENVSDLVANSSAGVNSIILEVLVKKITWNLNEVINLLSGTSENSQDNNFVSLMDSVILDMKSKEISSLKYKIDDLLCHALTIAKLSSIEDFQEISACCKNVLAALTPIQPGEVGESFSLNQDYVLLHLEILGRKINTSLLRLFLHVMTSPSESLKHLVKKCRSEENKIRLEDDLDDLIADFDLTTDRIHLIGNFALTSCDDKSLCLNVQNCLADLEFIEESLVPSISSFYLESSNLSKRELTKYLCDEWKKVANSLNKHLEQIIEPGALLQVAMEDLSNLLDKIRGQSDVTSKESTDLFLKRSNKLYNILKNTPEDFSISDNDGVTELLTSLKRELTLVENKSENLKYKIIPNLEDILAVINSISLQIVNFLNPSMNSSDGPNASALTNISVTSSFTPNRKGVSFLHDGNALNTQFVTPMKMNVTLEKHFKKAQEMTPFTPTLYIKTPNRKRKQRTLINFPESETFC